MHMKERSRYVFGAALASAALGGLPGLMERASAATVTQAAFTFEVSGIPLNATNVTSPAIGPLVAESGIGSAFGSHVSTSTVWSSPAGNGSQRSFSSNNWAQGDFYSFSVPTTGVQDIMVSFDQQASSTGPHVFSLLYSTNGTSFSTFTNYTVPVVTVTSTGTAGSTTVGFSTGASNAAFAQVFDLSGITGLNNNVNAIFRLVDADTTATATAGTNRVDNFVVSGNAVPEPAAVSLVTIATATGLLRRRRGN
jgi:hypothetical protein